MTEQVASTPAAPRKLSEEPGFVSFEIFRPHYMHKLPLRTPGLLAFLFSEEDSEMVLKLLMLDDLAKGFLESRPFCGRANRAAYRPFHAADNREQGMEALAERLRLYAQLTEKYNAPQTSWPMGKFHPDPRA
jgi:hypothetical protein